MKRLLAVLSSCVIGVPCQKGSTAPSNPMGATPPILDAPRPPLHPPESWPLTASVTSGTPHPRRRDVTGLALDWMLNVRRAEPMRLFVYWAPTDGIEYAGSTSGRDLSLAGDFNRGNSLSLSSAPAGS